MADTASVFIDGQAGTTGLEISERLSHRTDIDLLTIEEARRKDPEARAALMDRADVTILCLPDDAALAAVTLGSGRTRFLDASTAHRTDPNWVYGCPELCTGQRELIASADRVSNPGCYPQGFILLIRPLVDAGVISKDAFLSLTGLSGYSGGGRAMVEAYQAFNAAEADALCARPYALHLNHKHRPEMQYYTGLKQPPLFSPTVANYYRGMLVEVPLHRAMLAEPVSGAEIGALLTERYSGEPFIEVHGFQPEQLLDGGYLNATATNGSNRMQLMVFGNDDQLLLVARYDNLGKGASGAAVQNLNLMLGFEETLELTE